MVIFVISFNVITLTACDLKMKYSAKRGKKQIPK